MVLLKNPGQPELDIEREKQRLEKAIEDLRANGLVELTWLEGRTWYHLQRAMRRDPWHIFHFIGHGGYDANTDEGLIALEDDAGKAHLLSATHLGRLLTDHRSLRLVVLNSCEGAKGSERDIFSSTAAILVRRGIPAVLAMQYEITDQAAIELSRTFYEALADGLPVDTAVGEARKSISLGIVNTVEWGTPVLYMRSPDGVLFDVRPVVPKPQGLRKLPDQAITEKVPLPDESPSSGEQRSETTQNEPSTQAPSKLVEQAKQSEDTILVPSHSSTQTNSPSPAKAEVPSDSAKPAAVESTSDMDMCPACGANVRIVA